MQRRPYNCYAYYCDTKDIPEGEEDGITHKLVLAHSDQHARDLFVASLGVDKVHQEGFCVVVNPT